MKALRFLVLVLLLIMIPCKKKHRIQAERISVPKQESIQLS